MKAFVGAIASVLLGPIFVLGSIGSTGALPSHEFGSLDAAILSNPNIALTAGARADVEAGVADPRVLQLLLALADRFSLARVGPIKSGHSYFVKGTSRVSNHSFGRAVDVGVINGELVSPSNTSAHEAVEFVLSLPKPARPDEVGSPWKLDAPGSFTDSGHQGHAHFGFGANP